MGLNNLLGVALLIGLALIGATLGVDLKTRRGYGILALALLVAVTLAYSWANAIDVIEAEEHATRGGGLVAGLVILLYWLATLLATGFVSVAGLIEMRVARRRWWFAGLLVALALLIAQAIQFFFFPHSILDLSHIFPISDAPHSFLVSQIVYEGIPLLVCATYGAWRSWPRAQVATQ